MSYQHIENLYRPEAQRILEFRRVYVMEKIHGTSANVRFSGTTIQLHAGGVSHESFAALFGSQIPDVDTLALKLIELFGTSHVVIYGEAYGGKCQGMRKTYGESLRFVAFEVKVYDLWLDVPNAADVCGKLGIPFVWYELVTSDLPTLDAYRDRDSEQAKRNGIEEPRPMEGIVIRPPFEARLNNGGRLVAKHKRPEFSERATIPDVDPTKRKLMEDAEKIAEEFVTSMRLNHVLDKLGNPTDFQSIPLVIAAMVEDVCREASGEIVDNKAVRKAIGGRAAALYKARSMIVKAT